MSGAALEGFDGLDWDCKDEDTRYLTHGYHPYSAKYIPQIPRYLISALSVKGHAVVDPFVGSGTGLVECKLLGRRGVGLDVNPLACLVSEVKSTPIEPSVLKREVASFLTRATDCVSRSRGRPTLLDFGRDESELESRGPAFAEAISRWFQPAVIAELSVMKAEVLRVEDRAIRNFLLVAFSSILRGVSDAASGYGNLMISHDPPVKKHVFERFRSQAETMVSEMGRFWSLTEDHSPPRVILGDCRRLSEYLGPESADLICTHPPYMAAVPYAEYQKLSLWWLGFDPRKLDSELIGGQRSRTDTAARFESDMQKCFAEMYSVLKSGCYCCTVIGNPTYRGQTWNLNETFVSSAQRAGFTLMKEIPRRKFRMTVGKMKQEFIQVFRKG